MASASSRMMSLKAESEFDLEVEEEGKGVVAKICFVPRIGLCRGV